MKMQANLLQWLDLVLPVRQLPLTDEALHVGNSVMGWSSEQAVRSLGLRQLVHAFVVLMQYRQ